MKKDTKKKASSPKQKRAAKKKIENMKYEIAEEMGLTLGANKSSKANGKVGGEITKRLVKKGKTKTSKKEK